MWEALGDGCSEVWTVFLVMGRHGPTQRNLLFLSMWPLSMLVPCLT